uniref:Eva-1 homolog C n=1 Tax=Sinocyclocheilus grahami TaxID=75366 RepID=A0A672LY24_SINGR
MKVFIIKGKQNPKLHGPVTSFFKALIDNFFFKYLLLYISKDICLTAEHKKRVTCEGDQLLLHCKYPKVLNIYSAVYGRQLEGEDLCPSEEQHPPFECLFHGAVDVVSNICYGKQRCLFTIDEEHLKNPCPPGTKKYITVLYACGMNALISIEIFPKQIGLYKIFYIIK